MLSCVCFFLNPFKQGSSVIGMTVNKNHSRMLSKLPKSVINPHGFHGLVGLTRPIPFDIEKVALQPSVSKGKFPTSAL